MKQTLFITALITSFLLASCSKEKKVEKMLYGEWEVTSFMHGANDLTQFYKDSCGCRLMFSDTEISKCYLYCPHNSWNFYLLELDSLNAFCRTEIFDSTLWSISNEGGKIDWFFGNTQPDSIYRWGMYPLTIRNKSSGAKQNSFIIEEISKEKLTLTFTDSINDTYIISFIKIRD